MNTQFCEARVPLWDDLSLYLDGNSKITRNNGTYAKPRPNAFSLPAASVTGGGYCPGSTVACRSSCYVHGLAAHAPGLYAHYRANAHALICALQSAHKSALSASILGDWIAANAPHGFRWHVSGDVWNLQHADWIVAVCAESPTVPHWIYTRTLDAVDVLRQAPNLAVNVSADRDNFAMAQVTAIETGARLTYLLREGETPPVLPPDSVIFPDYPLRGRSLPDPLSAPLWPLLSPTQRAQICPADFFGQSEAHRCGPCRKCLT